MKVLDLFSGIGGFSLGLERAGMETVAFCEIEDHPRNILAKHISIRALLPILNYTKKTNSFKVLNEDEKVVVYLYLHEYSVLSASVIKNGNSIDDDLLKP